MLERMDAPALHADACLNAKAAHACRRCAQACPEEAISIREGGAPELNPGACTACGRCVAACPTDAWALAGDDGAAWFARLSGAAAGRGTLVVRCERAQGDGEGVGIPCLGLFRPAWLLVLAALGVRRVVVRGADRCGGCPRRHGGRHWQEVKARAHAWQRRLARPLPELVEDGAAAGEGRGAARRAFLRSGLLDLVRAAAEAAAPARGDRLPERTAIVRALRRLGAGYGTVESDPWWPFGGLVAHENCTLCGDCVDACPTGALAIERAGHALLRQDPVACVGCDACARACPEGAMERTPGVQWPVLAAGLPVPLRIAMAETEEEDDA